MNEQPSKMSGKDKKKGRNRFNMLFTLLFIIAIFALLFNMMGDDSWGENKITPLTFYKLLYTCRISKLEISGTEKIEGEYRIQTFAEDYYDSGRAGPANLKKFFVELSREELQARVPEFSTYLGRTVQKGSGDLLWNNLAEDRIFITSYYKVVCDDPDLISSEMEQDEKNLPGREEMALSATLLFVDFVDGNGASRFERYDLAGAGVSSGNTWNMKKILAAIGEKFPNAGYREFSLQNEGSLRFNRPNTFLTSLVATLIPWILIIGVFWFFILRQMKAPGGGGVLSFGRSRATIVNKEKTGITFKDVAGIEEAKEEVTEIIEFLKDPGRFSRLGGRVPRGVLLVGSPGTGKTLLAKAIAGEADVPFYSISGSDFVEMFVGVGASRVRDLFRQARENSPCLIFLDEIDAVGRKRGSGLGGGHDEREQTLNAILVEMDGFETDEGVILLAATNRPDVLDPALLRPGRFDREIVIDLPDLNGRKAILEVHCRKIKLAEDVDLDVIARGTPSFSGAELSALVNESALIATMKDKNAVDMDDLEEARDKVRWGRQKKSRVMDEEDRLITAYHEAGHAFAAHILPETEPLHKVTIIPRGMALGATMQLPEKDRYHHRRKELLGNLVVLYAGRAAEEIFCGDISGGAQNDIERASEIARIMVCRLGMSDSVGPISYDNRQDHVFLGEELVRSRSHGVETLKRIDEEVRKILGDGYERARTLISENKDHVEAITQALMKYESLSVAEVSGIIAGKNIEEIKAEADAAKKAGQTELSAVEKEKEGAAEPEGEEDKGDLPAEGEFAY